jgi:hypothetical protein
MAHAGQGASTVSSDAHRPGPGSAERGNAGAEGCQTEGERQACAVNHQSASPTNVGQTLLGSSVRFSTTVI